MNKLTSPAALRVTESDICIVGNGAIAKTAALGLAQAGLSVTLLGPPAPPPTAPAADPGWDARVPSRIGRWRRRRRGRRTKQSHTQAGLGQAQRRSLGNRAIANDANITFGHAQRGGRGELIHPAIIAFVGNDNCPLRFASRML